MIPLPPPRLVLPSLDFETSSEAGYAWNAATNKWGCLPHASQDKKGLRVVGAAVYAEHPSTRVLTASYDLLDGRGVRRWKPTRPNPQDLFDYLAAGGLLGAWNTTFEQWIWNVVCVRLYGWPALNPAQLRCTMARARAHCLPGKLGMAAQVMGWPQQKNKGGTRLINKFCVPRNPTKADPRVWIRPEDNPEDAENLYSYCDEDVLAEAGAAAEIPELSAAETEYWLVDQEINRRGVRIDVAGMENCIAIIDQVHAESDAQLPEATQGAVEKTSQIARISAWLHTQGVHTDSLDEEHLDALLKTELPDAARKVLLIRQVAGSAAVKKAYAMRNTLTKAGRLHDLFTYHASRTGRCIAEGEKVLTQDEQGRIANTPIEEVLLSHRIWDGREWVTHGGVVSQGIQDVITHDGVTATPGHLVFISTTEYAKLSEVKEKQFHIFRGESPCPTTST